MKKFFLVAVFAMVSTSALFAQFDLGVKAGLNMANITNSRGSEMKPSVYAGIFIESEREPGYIAALAVEALYSRQGLSASLGGIKARLRLNYINVPILIKLYPHDSFSFDLGPQFGLLLSADEWAKQGGISATADVKESFSQLDISACFGVTYNIGRFMIQGRYNLGLLNLAKVTSYFSFDKYLKLHNRVAQFGVGYRF